MQRAYTQPNTLTANRLIAKDSLQLAGTWYSSLMSGTSGWKLTGNNIGATNFLGATNNLPLVFKVNNVRAGYLGISSTANTSFGTNSLSNFSTGYNNTAIGYDALLNSTTGVYNTAIGAQSMRTNTTGGYNTAIGESSLYTNLNGIQNSAVGNYSLRSNSSGSGNSANGYQALYSNTTGNSNVSTGFNSLYNNTTGSFNVGVGYNSLQANTSGSNNTAVGNDALQSLTTGTKNTAIGPKVAPNATIGSYNSFFGDSTGAGITTGSYNTIIGARVSGLSSSLSNNIILADGQGNRRLNIDNSGNVGIGTTTPAEKLDIDGNLNFSGSQFIIKKGGNNVVFSDGTFLELSDGSGNSPSFYSDASTTSIRIGNGGNDMLVGDGSHATSLYAAGNLVIEGTPSETTIIGGSTNVVNITQLIKLGAVTFSGLPASPVTGMIAHVSDSNTGTWGATIAGGGGNTVLAFYNGINWTVIGK